MSPPALAVADLVVVGGRRGREVRTVDGISFAVGEGERLALVGESGSGKSMTALAVMGLLPPRFRIAGGTVRIAGQAIEPASPGMAGARGRDVAMVFQDPTSALNPVMTVGEQVAEAILAHAPVGRAEARRRAIRLLDQVRIARAAERFASYPHEFSGGMRQRVMIAMALAHRPRLLIADEPTTALDVTTQIAILDLVEELCRLEGTALLLITHDFGIVEGFCDRVVVLYGGRVMEVGQAVDVVTRPRHPYTAGLLRSIPPPDRDLDRLEQIEGEPPASSGRPAPGCPFAPRCRHAFDRCRREIPALVRPGGVLAACHLLDVETAAPALAS